MESSMRSKLCGEVSEALEGQPVSLCGWVDRRRDLGGLIFFGLRDRAGIIQVVIEPDSPAFADAEKLRNEYCVRITGQVRLRPESQWNAAMATGKVEVVATEVELLNASAPLPLMMSEEDGEEVRLKYRYLDLRRPRMQRNLRIRAALNRAIRKHLDANGFAEFETPILTRATPEGARDYRSVRSSRRSVLDPTRLQTHPGRQGDRGTRHTLTRRSARCAGRRCRQLWPRAVQRGAEGTASAPCVRL
jgi:aspartyl-tRNA synthetase